MRPITKIFILLLVAFGVYVLWPRHADMRDFNPREVAKYRVRAWVAEREGNGMAGTLAGYKVYAGEYGFPPIAALRVAQSEVAAVRELEGYPEKLGAADRALPPLREKYVLIKAETGSDLDPEVCAREELAWRALEAEGASVKSIANARAKLFASIYGGKPSTYLEPALALAGARSFVVGGKAPADGTDARQAGEQIATEGFEKLHAIVGGDGLSAD